MAAQGGHLTWTASYKTDTIMQCLLHTTELRALGQLNQCVYGNITIGEEKKLKCYPPRLFPFYFFFPKLCINLTCWCMTIRSLWTRNARQPIGVQLPVPCQLKFLPKYPWLFKSSLPFRWQKHLLPKLVTPTKRTRVWHSRIWANRKKVCSRKTIPPSEIT